MKHCIGLSLAVLMLFCIESGDAKTKWHVTLNGGKLLYNATFDQLLNDTVTISSEGTTGLYALQDITGMQCLQSSSNYLVTTLVGIGVMGGLGYLLGDMEDEEGNSKYKVTWGLSGAATGGVLGALASSSSEKSVDYNLQGYKLEEKRSILENIIAERSMISSLSGKQNDVVYLRKGGTVKGAISENVSDSSVSVTTTDGSTFTYKRSEILMISQNDPSYKAEQSMNADYALANNRIHLEVHLGGAIPTGQFGPNSSAAAVTGFSVEGRLVLPLSGETPPSISLQSITSLTGTFNGLNVDVPQGSGASVGVWTLGFPMTGLRLITSSSGDYDFYMMAQGGLLLGAYPSSNENSNKYQTSASTIAFAYRTGVGMIIDDKFLFEANYIASNPEYSVSGYREGNAFSEKIKQPTSLITLTAGLIFSF